MQAERVLLLGGSGQLGTALRDAAVESMIAPSHAEFDLLRDDFAEMLARYAPAVVVNCASFHHVDRCEAEGETAFAMNAVAVDRLARACARRDVLFVTVSTDYVFAGDLGRAYAEADRPCPGTVYGTSKLAGELLALREGRRCIIVRTSGLFGTKQSSSRGYTLIDKVLAQAEAGLPPRMVDDVTFSPSYAPHVARAILHLVERRALGVHHVTNGGFCTWYQFVREAFRRAGHADAVLEPIASSALATAVRRPAYSVLANTTFAALGIGPLPSWQDALDEYLAARARGGGP